MGRGSLTHSSPLRRVACRAPTWSFHFCRSLAMTEMLLQVFHLLHFFLHRPPPSDLRTTPPSLSLWSPVQGSLGDGGHLAGDMANPPIAPAPPHWDGGHGFGSTPVEQVFVWNGFGPQKMSRIRRRLLAWNMDGLVKSYLVNRQHSEPYRRVVRTQL